MVRLYTILKGTLLTSERISLQ